MPLICLHRAVSRSSLVDPPLLVLANEHQPTPEPNFILESDPWLQEIMLRKGMAAFSIAYDLFKFEDQSDWTGRVWPSVCLHHILNPPNTLSYLVGPPDGM
jgi:hypothetical protein